MTRVSGVLRQQVIERANGCCEYCQAQQAIVIEMEVDHIIPESKGGPTRLDNLCLACVTCNGFKLNFTEGLDPETDAAAPLFNPRLHTWSEHFRWHKGGTELIGLTSVGRATISRLNINRPLNRIARQNWVQAGWHPPKLD